MPLSPRRADDDADDDDPFLKSSIAERVPSAPTGAAAKPEVRYCSGLSVGHPGSEPTALAVLMRQGGTYHLLGFRRWQPAGDVAKIAGEASWATIEAGQAHKELRGSQLAIERSGIADATYQTVYQAFQDTGLFRVPILVGGDKTVREGAAWRVPRIELAALVAQQLNSGSLLIDSKQFPEANTILAELKSFCTRRPAGAPEIIDARVSGNEDVPRAISTALFLATRSQAFYFRG